MVGEITSKNYPEEYPSNYDCTYVIIYPEEAIIRVEVSEFELEYDYDCEYDSLEV
jgi:hypothetical protein